MPLLFPIYSLFLTATSLPGMMARFLAVWEREVPGSTLNVLSVSLLPLSPRLEAGPLVVAPRLMPFFTLLSGVRISHSSSCAFESVTLVSDCQSVPTILYAPLLYLLPESLTDSQSLLNSLSDYCIRQSIFNGFLVIFLSGNGLADFLAKVGATHDPSTIPLSLSPLISSQLLSLCTSWRRDIQSVFFQHQIPSVSFEELTLPLSARCAVSRFAAPGTALFLLHTSTGLVEPKLLRAATVVLNHGTSFSSC